MIAGFTLESLFCRGWVRMISSIVLNILLGEVAASCAASVGTFDMVVV